MGRPYRLGRRQVAVDETATRILAAARRLVEAAPSSGLRIGEVAREAGVTRATVYNRFRSRAGLIGTLAPPMVEPEPDRRDPREAVRLFLAAACARWAVNPSLHRHLPIADGTESPRRLAEDLTAADALRPGCSLREAEDVLGALASFAIFDRLHHDGRRPPAAVAEILFRLAGGILA